MEFVAFLKCVILFSLYIYIYIKDDSEFLLKQVGLIVIESHQLQKWLLNSFVQINCMSSIF